MKKIVLLGLFLGVCGMVAGGDVLLTAISLKPGENAHIWSVPDIKASSLQKDGALQLQVAENATPRNDMNNGQLMVQIPVSLTASKQYALTLTLKGSENMSVRCNVLQNQEPYANLAEQTVKLEKNTACDIRLNIRPAKDISGIYRMPNLCFGAMPTGSSVTLSDVRLWEVQ